MNKGILFILFQLCIVTTAVAQSPKQVLDWINTVKVAEQDVFEEIPFEYKNGCIVIKVTVGTNVYDYIFDTGGYNIISDEIQALNNFPVLTTQTVGSANKMKSKINIVKAESFKIGKLVFNDVAALQMNFNNSPTVACTINGGLIGASIIKKYYWQIDYQLKKITITNQPNRLQGIDKAAKLPVSYNSRLMPYVNLKINGLQERLMLDLGSTTLLTMTEKTGKRYSKGKPVINIDGATLEGANGVSKDATHIMQADSVSIGNISLAKVPVHYFSSVNESTIGNPIIKNYKLTLAFPDNAVYLEPVLSAPLAAGLETYGFSLKYADGKVYVATLYKGLAADKAGLRTGDIVTKADGKPLNFKDECSALKPLAELLRTGNIIELEVLRNGNIVPFRINKVQAFSNSK